MPDKNQQFACTNCGAQYQKWTGRCLECGKWSTVEAVEAVAEPTIGRSLANITAAPLTAKPLSEVASATIDRTPTCINELDRVLGGGLVPGSLILLGGEPGIGKSTLAMQVALSVPGTLYISGEESAEQVKSRADRINKTENINKNPTLRLANSTHTETIIATLQKDRPQFAIIDSIQTIASDDASGEPGSVSQIRASTAKLLEVAKTNNITLLIIGHVTKDGAVAGPKTLEHLVDTVLYFEGDPRRDMRILRAVKNRFGSTDEVGVFDMSENGLKEIANPSASLLAERGDNLPGSIVTPLMEGSRPILVEIQALVNKTVFGYPVRKASGFDLNRLHVLIAVLTRRAGLELGSYDIHINVVGGIEANEPAADLAVALAIASAYKDKPAGVDLAVFGEVGLGGEVRGVRHADRRIKECESLGMKRVIAPAGKQTLKSDKAKIIRVANIQELITHA